MDKKDFACPCCGKADVDGRFLTAINKLKDLAARNVTITSGYRCPDHNAKVGGTLGSYHVRGLAADIVIEDLSVYEMYLLAEQVPGFSGGGIGIYPQNGFIHVDMRGERARWAKVDGRFLAIWAGVGVDRP